MLLVDAASLASKGPARTYAGSPTRVRTRITSKHAANQHEKQTDANLTETDVQFELARSASTSITTHNEQMNET